MASVTALPQPSAATQTHSARLSREIKQLIDDADGFLSFAAFMQAALYTPGLGYYSSELRKFGPDGDFVTAPELSPLFAECVANQVHELLVSLGDGAEILEFGAGTGRFAVGLLESLDDLGVTPARYTIVEISAELRRRQETLLAQCMPAAPVQWCDTLPVRRELVGVVIANEVVDAMPVRRFKKVAAQAYEEVGVGLRDGEFVWKRRAADAQLVACIQAIEHRLEQNLPVGYVSELCPTLAPWVASIADFLVAGCVLIVDYGYPRREYFQPDRHDGTLRCHYQHRAHDNPFYCVGLQDISAAVDFSAVAQAGVENGLAVAGFTTQAHFLLGCGLDERLAERAAGSGQHYTEVAAQAKTLTLPGEMGEYFKVIALARGTLPAMRGFSFRDLQSHL